MNVVSGTGEVVGDALVRHPDVRKIALTGSTQTGRIVTERSAEDGRRLVFAINHSSVEQTLTLETKMDDLFNEERVEEDVAFPPYGVRVLRSIER